MSSILSGIKFTLSSSDKDKSFVPLSALLLQKKIVPRKDDQAQTSQATPDPVDIDTRVLKSRKATRKQLKSKTSPQDFKSPNSSKAQKSIRLRQIESIQSLNTKRLMALKKELEGLDSNASTFGSSKKEGDVIPDFEPAPLLSNLELDPDLKIPVALALVDFLPLYDGTNATAAKKGLDLKRAARMLNLDMQASISPALTRKQEMVEIPIARYLKSFLDKRNHFYESLSLDNITMLGECLDAFNLKDEGASTTEILYVIFREYASAIRFASPRFGELPQRKLDAGRMLPRYALYEQSYLGDVYNAVMSEGNPISRLTNRAIDDAELTTKMLAHVVGKETLYSANIVRNLKSLFSGKGGQFNPDLVDPHFLLDVYANEDRLRAEFPDGEKRTAHNIFYKSSEKVERNYAGQSVFVDVQRSNFPYERNELTDRSFTGRTKSAPQFVKSLYREDSENQLKNDGTLTSRLTNKSFKDNYEATVSSMIYAKQRIEAITQPQRFVTAGSTVYPFFKALKISHSNFLAAAKFQNFAIESKILELAFQDDDVLRELLIYLAFRQEKKMNYQGAGAAPDGASKLLRKSSWLRGARTLTVSSGTRIRTQTVDPKVVTIDPGVGSPPITNIVSPSKRTTIGIEVEAAEGDSGRLEQLYDVTFEEIAHIFADIVFARMIQQATPDKADSSKPGQSSEGYGYDFQITRSSIRDALESIDGARSAGTEGFFDEFMNFNQHLNGQDQETIYNNDDKTLLNKIDRETIFGLFVMMTSAIQALVVPKLFVCRNSVKLVGTGQVNYTIGLTNEVEPSISTEKFLLRKLAGYPSKIQAISNFLNDPKKYLAAINATFPELARIQSDLTTEQDFIHKLADPLYRYFQNVAKKFAFTRQTLGAPIGNQVLGQIFSKGLAPSFDQAKLLTNVPISLNHKQMYYEGRKIDDSTISEELYYFILEYLSLPQYSSKSAVDSKILVLGLPSGILEDLEALPIDLDRLSKQDPKIPDVFNVVVEKFDETKPNVEFTKLRFPFSRSIFIKGVSAGDIQYSFTDRNLKTTEMSGDVLRKITSRTYASLTDQIIANHNFSFCAQKYLDIQYDLDVSELAFPNNQDRLSNMFSSRVKIPALKFVDLDKAEFLSGSNLIFDPDKLRMRNMRFFDSKDFSIELTEKSYTDPYKYSAFDYSNTYGSIFVPDSALYNLKDGAIFEKTICVMFNDDDFDVKSVENPDSDTHFDTLEDKAKQEAKLATSLLNQKYATLDNKSKPEASLITYRAYIELTDTTLKQLVNAGIS